MVVESKCEYRLNLIELESFRLVLKYFRLREVHVGWAHLTANMQGIICRFLPPTMERLNISGCNQGSHMGDKGNISL